MYRTLLPNRLAPPKHTLNSLSSDILYIIGKELDFLSTLFLRLTCRSIYLSFPDTILFSHVFLPPSITQKQFHHLFSYLQSARKLSFIRKLTFDNSKITSDAIIKVLQDCENIQYLYILGCKDLSLLPITNAITGWYEEYKTTNKGDATGKRRRRMEKLEKIVMTRCIGGKRHSLLIKKMLEDLERMKKRNEDAGKKCHEVNSDTCELSYGNSTNTISSISISSVTSILSTLVSNDSTDDDTDDGIFRLQSCSDPTCEPCTLTCADCGIKYKYWDKVWIKCNWCKNRHFCGACITKATARKSALKNYSFRFERIKLCQMFDMPCPK